MAQLGHVWTQVGLSMRSLVLCAGIWRRSRARDMPNVGSSLHEPPSKPKKVGNNCKNASFQRVALSRHTWPGLVGPSLGLGLNLAQLGPKLHYLEPDPSPSSDGPQIEAM